jgi:Cu(I)/Ag(I) efflux system membrane protein CusA/SilA
MIRDEEGLLTGCVFLDLNTRDYGGFVSDATRMLNAKLKLPAGYIVPVGLSLGFRYNTVDYRLL